VTGIIGGLFYACRMDTLRNIQALSKTCGIFLLPMISLFLGLDLLCARAFPMLFDCAFYGFAAASTGNFVGVICCFDDRADYREAWAQELVVDLCLWLCIAATMALYYGATLDLYGVLLSNIIFLCAVGAQLITICALLFTMVQRIEMDSHSWRYSRKTQKAK
jgi:hypothetical protein